VATINPPPQTETRSEPSPRNLRASVRYHCPPAATGRLYLAEDVAYLRAWLQDISLTGIGLLLSKALDTGLFVTIQIKCENSEKTFSLCAHVIHSTQLATGDWIVGCQFVEQLNDDDLDHLLR
jgi:c-di-GMP-binding flagellar brake protein YcgR